MRISKASRRLILPAFAAALLTGQVPQASAANVDPFKGVVLSKSYVVMRPGTNDTLYADILPFDAPPEAVAWKIDDATVATVDGDGVVTAVGLGTATLTATSREGYKAACTIKVSDKNTDFTRNFRPGGGMGGPGGGTPPDMASDGTRPEMPQGGMGGGPGGGMGGGPGGGMGGGMGGGPGGGMGGGPGGGMGGGRMGGGMGNRSFGSQSKSVSDESDATDDNGYVQQGQENELDKATYSSKTSDANAIKLTGGRLVMTDCTISKLGGNTKSDDGSNYYGLNAAVLARRGAGLTMTGGTIDTKAKGASGIVAYSGFADVAEVTINCAEKNSRGISATNGGVIEAYNLTVNTKGQKSQAIALAQGGGVTRVIGGSYTTEGKESEILYSTGDLTVNNITGKSSQGEIGVVEGDNFIAINNCDLTGGAGRGLLLLQSGSGNAGFGLNGIITVAGGALAMTDKNAPLIEVVTNVNGRVTLDGVKTTIPSGVLMAVDYNKSWNTYGATGVLILSGEGTTYTGSVTADKYSSSKVTVNEGVVWEGAYDTADTGSTTTLTINGGTWTLTDDSCVDRITLNGGATINKNGHKLTYTSLKQNEGTIND